MEDIEIVLRSIIKSIREEDITVLERLIEQVDLENTDASYSAELFSILINECVLFSFNTEPAEVVLITWMQLDDEYTKYPFTSRLWIIKGITDDALKLVVLALKNLTTDDGQSQDINYMKVMMDTIENEYSVDSLEVCHKLERIFGNQDAGTYKILKDVLNERQLKEEDVSSFIVEFIDDKLSKILEYANTPEWIHDFTKEAQPNLPFDDELLSQIHSRLPLKADEDSESFQFQPPTPDKLADDVVESLASLSFSREDLENNRDKIMGWYSLLTYEQKIEFYKPIYVDIYRQKLIDDIQIYQALGPSNMQTNSDLSLDNPCTVYGGCRMFTCLEYENGEDETDLYEEDPYAEDSGVHWFTGSCDQCNKRIRRPCYAVRKPIPHGGWLGCFCSWNCIRETLEGGYDDMYILTSRLVDKHEKKIKEIGIQDRKYR